MLMAPNTGKRWEKRIERGDELEAWQSPGSSAHMELEGNTVLTAGTASRRGTRLSSYVEMECTPFRHDPAQPQEVADFIVAEGGNPPRTIVSHIDRTLFTDDDLLRLADTGCVIEFI